MATAQAALPLDAASDRNRQVWAWAFYDWANSAFATTVMAGFFPIFFKSYWADPADPHHSTFVLGLANSAASLAMAFSAPLLGSIADRGAAKKRFLACFAGLGACATAGLWLVSQGDWPAAAALYVIAALGFLGANVFYDSLLPAVSDDASANRISALGFGMGYLGGGLLFGANVLMFLKPHLFGIADGASAVKLSFLTVAVWWTLFSLPLLLLVQEPAAGAKISLSEAAALGYRQLRDTFGHLRRYRQLGLFLLAYWLYIDGVDTIVTMAVDYGMSLGFPSSALIQALLIVQIMAFPAAIAYGRLGDRLGTRPAILLAIAAYCGITVLAFFMREVSHFYLLAAGVGLFQGGIQALSRSFFMQMIPKDKAGEFFGFYNMLGKFAAVLGPVLMGAVTFVFRDSRLGILSIIILFVLGGAALTKVDLEQARREAQ